MEAGAFRLGIRPIGGEQRILQCHRDANCASVQQLKTWPCGSGLQLSLSLSNVGWNEPIHACWLDAT